MKIKILKNYKYNILKLNLIKSKLYKSFLKKNENGDSIVFGLEQIEFYLKKILQVIYEYHINNKKILFIGMPIFLQKNLKKVFKKTNHILIPNGIWVNGLLSNKISINSNLNLKRLKSIKKQRYNINNINLLLTITKQPDLIIIFDRSVNSNVITEISKLRIPVIFLNNDLFFDLKSAYKVTGNSIKINFQILNIFFTAISLIIKTSTKFQ
jgi:ribosomal protein S2